MEGIFLWYMGVLVAGLLLIEEDDDTRSWSNSLVYFSHNGIPT
jgi:hypothetical protein